MSEDNETIEGVVDEFAIEPVIDGNIIEISPMDVNGMTETYRKMTEFVQRVMRMDVDYGIVPGTKKPSLYKPGAEKLQRFFGFSTVVKLSHSVEQWEQKVSETTFPLFHYRYTTTVYAPNGKIVATSDGECNSYESKYRWRWVSRDKVPSKYDLTLLETQVGTEREPAFAISKKETSGQYGKPIEYWQSWEDDIANGRATKVKMKKRDGGDMDAWERGGSLYRIPNEDVFSQVNTLMKMSQKRSYVGGVIIAANASEYFTQDVEDYQKSEETVSIRTLVPSKTTMAQKLVNYAASLGIPDAGNWIKEQLEVKGITWSLDNWNQIITMVEEGAEK